MWDLKSIYLTNIYAKNKFMSVKDYSVVIGEPKPATPLTYQFTMDDIVQMDPPKPMSWDGLKKRPVFAFVTTVLIVISLLYFFGLLKTLPCGDGVLRGLNRTFVHVDLAHILSNLFVFYVLSRIEMNFGSKFFVMLIVQLLILTTALEWIVKQFWNIPCSIGFSGVLFGLAVWELVYDRNLNMALLLGIGAMIITPSLHNPKASLIGHGLGALAGLIMSFYFKPPGKKTSSPTGQIFI
jgi:membrane associated rhomboid family serine protease